MKAGKFAQQDLSIPKCFRINVLHAVVYRFFGVKSGRMIPIKVLGN
tara:strand:+ start:1590 stop:1727 length:138 start_codon:yes stop_codon:yes gene_type:complete